MTQSQFKRLLESAISGNMDSLESLLELYAPLINRYSYINGKFDEDLRQHLILHIIKNLNKFKIVKKR